MKFITKVLKPGRSSAYTGPQNGELMTLFNWWLKKCT